MAVGAGPAAENEQVDAVVIGGGPAGLTGALYLARFRRKVLLVDAGDGRALRIPRSHNLPGYPDGVAGRALIAAMRCQAERYGVRSVAGRVASIEPAPNGGFLLRWRGGAARARQVLLATGASDAEPALPQLAEALSAGALRYCPVCDGYEVIDARVGLLVDSARDFGEALYLRHFTPHLSVFRVSARVRFATDQRQRLAAAGIALIDTPVSGLQLDADGGVVVRHGTLSTRLDSLYSALGLTVHTDLARALGARCADDGTLETDRDQQTSVAGLYAAGDVSRGLNQISVAMGDASIAAAAMHRALLHADVHAGAGAMGTPLAAQPLARPSEPRDPR